LNTVIPAQAGIHFFLDTVFSKNFCMDSRLHGNDCVSEGTNDTSTIELEFRVDSRLIPARDHWAQAGGGVGWS